VLQLLEDENLLAAQRMEDALFAKYWGESVPPEQRIQKWLDKADAIASGWKPSDSLFKGQNKKEQGVFQKGSRNLRQEAVKVLR